MHYFSFQIKEWISNTAHLSLEEEAIYLRLINYYYDSEKAIPLEGNPVSREFSAIIRKLRLTNQYELVLQVLEEFFTKTENGWIHDRCDQEIAKYHSMAEAGKRGAQKRWGNNKTPIASPLGSNSLPIDSPMPIKNKELIIKNKNIVAKPEGLSDEIWSDFLVLRKSKKLPLTKTAMQGLKREAKLANLPIKDVLQICCERGWAGFKAEWIKDHQNKKELPLGNEQQIAYAYIHECGGDPTKARFSSYWEMRDFILKFRDKQKNA